ncbi:hypothetical protein JCM19301_796 [Jejuia pallidilutea]|uniref:Uncharacterized protein n=1 Tax=Jejuia pallidilutea TaxID=504487 RepID=A0A090WUW8_9FLAO|nr:hypothetical protein JCM19301_796 [Jejuia pallidilutea]GAL71197.1 hypothetical protein JCM19302_626 [Jejuia pallidilutea]GAL88255.1 hypothetical protein JCM19538_2618 [Jejuia pallidilutea]
MKDSGTSNMITKNPTMSILAVIEVFNQLPNLFWGALLF